jgi:hypothetical protein
MSNIAKIPDDQDVKYVEDSPISNGTMNAEDAEFLREWESSGKGKKVVRKVRWCLTITPMGSVPNTAV